MTAILQFLRESFWKPQYCIFCQGDCYVNKDYFDCKQGWVHLSAVFPLKHQLFFLTCVYFVSGFKLLFCICLKSSLFCSCLAFMRLQKASTLWCQGVKALCLLCWFWHQFYLPPMYLQSQPFSVLLQIEVLEAK